MKKKKKSKENFIRADEFTFLRNENFSYEKFVVKVEEQNEEMQNWILYQTVTNCDGEFVSERQKKLKNKENLICRDEFSSHKIKIFLRKNWSSE